MGGFVKICPYFIEQLLALAAGQGNVVAELYLGYMYEAGTGIAQNDAEAVRLFHAAADQGEGEAQLYLGGLYERGGMGVIQDVRRALYYYRLAAQEGYPEAIIALRALTRTR